MNVLLCQLDGSLPNLALMRIAKQCKDRGDEVELLHGAQFEARLFERKRPDLVYGSVIFRKTIPLAERLKRLYPDAILGGTGVDPARKGEAVPLTPVLNQAVTSIESAGFGAGESAADFDYSLYPTYKASIGFTQRGCRLRCTFCCVPYKEGAMRETQTIRNIWRGPEHPKHLHLLDNDFFGQPAWRERIAEIRDGGFKVSFNQGINARFLTDEAADAIASVDYRDDSMQTKRIYTAWDGRPKHTGSDVLFDSEAMFNRHGFELDSSVKSPVADERLLFDGLNRLVKYGVKPDHIMVYMLIGYYKDETAAHREYRRARLRAFGARPYPMPYIRTPELVGFQRWVIGAYDKRIAWRDWEAARYRPENLGMKQDRRQEELFDQDAVA